MISKSEYQMDVRVRREAESLVDAGHEVAVIDTSPFDATSPDVSLLGTGSISGFGTHRPANVSILYRGARWLALPEHRKLAIHQFQQQALRRARELPFKPEVIHAHDFPALEPSALLRTQFDAKLVYDAHEYWPGMARHGRPEPFRRRLQKATESRLAKSADRMLTVSDGAAALLARELDLREITVVRNTFPTNNDLHPPENPTGVVYAGRIGRGRDLEAIFTAGIWNAGFALSAMGPQDGSIVIPDHVYVLPSGPLQDVDKLLSAVGLAVVPLERGPQNHNIALPNKLFQAVSVGVPVIASDLPEIARVVNEYQLGSLYQPGDPSSFARAVDSTLENYSAYLTNVKAARTDLSWDLDSARLKSLYSTLQSQ